MSDLKRFWASWIQPTDDHRPLTFPPNEGVLGWWCSGYDRHDEAILCAVILAENEDEAFKIVEKDWPEIQEWRFIDQREDDFKPSDRFVMSDWMEERFA
jgi:hypothetical protein